MKQHLTKQQVIQYRLRVLKDAEEYGPTKTSRRYGIHRDTIYAWRREVEPQKRGPKGRVAQQTPEEVEELITQLRLATNYGPKRLVSELALIGVVVGEKAIRGALQRAELVKTHHKKRPKAKHTFYAPYPGYRMQVDTKVVPDDLPDLRSGERYQFTAIDIASKIRFLAIYDSLSNYNSIHFIREALAFFGDIGITVECVQTYNHGTFTNIYAGGLKKADHQLLRVHPVTQYLLRQGIEHKLSRPATPQHNGFVERSHRTDGEEFYRLVDLALLDLDQLQVQIKRWQFQYNYLRLHSSCGNQPPMKHYLERRESVLQTGA